ncbi:Rieske (2Fe-2S) protein [Noviherbaspirillum sedimenti]|uniref:Non-heme iron oxygenase ferredoxin subunit n=1 Tax=Noviherbaspirillum sedimenti TaxID=2320865 RepID=A0A3A3G5Z8_9BURK|nr:non-heme iron oxygenase ferredoxin subunit [Noviherbaspirillum sedimenti]RJG03361.1 non-heme iron oxygenase ferredoxin subunit [Noviherbaspirillum sedimenti]
MTTKYNEQSSYQIVAEQEEIPPGQSRKVSLEGRDLLICNAGGTFYAIDDRCPHAGASFEGGRIRGKLIACPLHGARFDLSNGKCLGGAYKPVSCFSVKVEDGQVSVDATQELDLCATGTGG